MNRTIVNLGSRFNVGHLLFLLTSATFPYLHAQPSWGTVMASATEEVAYFNYTNTTQTELYFSVSGDDHSYPPYTGYGGSSPSSLATLEGTLRTPGDWNAFGTLYSSATDRTVCAIWDRSSKPLYYWNGSVDYGNGTAFVNLSGFFIESSGSINLTGTEGLAFVGEFQGNGSVSSGYVDEAVYITERACADGDLEYGFARVKTASADDTFFYYSDYTNCDGSGGDNGCSTTGGLTFTAQTPIPTNSHYKITGLPSGNNLFRAYPVYNYGTSKWDMYFEVWNAGDTSIDTCSIQDPSNSYVVTSSSCQWTIQDTTFNANGVGSPFSSLDGYVAIVGQMQGSATQGSTDFKAHINSVSVGY
jgi:hypothetical protein